MDINKAIDMIRKFFVQHKRMPSYQEIAYLFGYATKASSQHLVKKLMEAGVLDKDENGKLVPKNLFSIPNLGIIKAGYPTVADMQHDAIDVYDYLLNRSGTIFSLTVKGDSMIDEGIHEGDIVIVEREREPRNGDVVAAQVDGEWTVKYYQNAYGEITLHPANKNYPIITPQESLEIGGVVVSVIRKYH
ncbi:MAG TPA: transcriptional repressor LexA [Candidatus Eisenbacteria bacterium]|nr:transcriptional repressor LexA [Candidatus Eisenbacteria bacterium]